ncbi:two-component sensor histidine kinase [Rhodoferax koreense]|uniref:histidine kinase n=1 Tax=Rhodoferax koreensis TaxID=1842727 RepID=A0A1P8JQJ2_9BURK|nr:HAMP domain-containing sensor histidine kinase [Rhodoferax koreense]APW36001.1 two-component sensor histidine kinase [Rhodoferax koreense]
MPATEIDESTLPGPTLPALLQRLYVRIWIAVLLAVAVLTMLVGWAWRMATDPPLRDVVVRNDAGQIIGKGVSRRAGSHRGLPGPSYGVADTEAPPPPPSDDDETDEAKSPVAEGEMQSPGEPGSRAPVSRGPEFVVRMQDGQRLLVHLPRPPRSSWWNRPPFGFFWMLGLVGVAMALAMYPIIRRLTRRLESLQRGVDQWGRGDLSARVPIHGRDEAGLLAQRFNYAAERIETLVASHKTLLQSQKSLLANASHELRSPLTRIRMGIELMGSTPSPTFKNEIARNIGELDELIEEILLASRLDAREADLGTVEEVDMTGLVAEECARLGASFEGNQEGDPDSVPGALASAETEDTGEAEGPPVAVRGVTKLLRRAVRNLLENARRYTTGPVTVTLQHTADRAVLQVFDRGPGVPPDQRERIFEPFYRLPGASERDGGVGLGLALVKSIAERHGGSVRCEGREGGGACFVIDLPSAA